MLDKEKIIKAVVAWMKKSKEFPTYEGLADIEIQRKDIRREWGNLTKLEAAIRKQFPDVWKACGDEREAHSLRNQIMNAYVNLAAKLSRPPTGFELTEEADIDRSTVHRLFGTLEKLHKAVAIELPEEMEKLFTNEMFTPELFERHRKTIKKHKKFFLTTAVAGCRVDQRCYDSLMQMCEETKTLPIFFPIADPARPNTKNGLMFFDSVLRDEVFLFDDLYLNSNCYLSNVLISAKQINPATGLTRIGQRAGTFIYASPKLSMHPIANSSGVPLVVLTTGAITEPDYDTDKYMSNRTAYIASHDHSMGGVIVEIIDDKMFHFRPVEFDNKGRLIDMGKMYDGKSIKEAKAAAFIYPDLHVAEMDQTAHSAFREIIKLAEPDYIVTHDSYDGFTTNGHDRWRNNTKARKLSSGLSVADEAEQYVSVMNALAEMCRKAVIDVKSNHPERIDRWVEDGTYIKDPINYEIGHELALHMLKDGDAQQYLAKKFGIVNKVRFLKRDESFKVGENPVEIGFHGDHGPDGKRGTLGAMDEALGRSITGHRHKPGIFRRAWCVGTGSILRQGWNKGPSSWMHTCGIVWANGTRTLINVIDGKWHG